MIGSWTANVANDPDKKASFEQYLQNNTRLLDRLKEIIEDREKGLETSEFSLSSYDAAGWVYKQAHINGRKAELTALKKIITI